MSRNTNPFDDECGVEIRPVDNGFVVVPTSRDYGSTPFSNAKVFQTFEELRLFLEDHFSHRNDCVEVD